MRKGSALILELEKVLKPCNR